MASSKAGFHQKATGELLIFDDITTNEAYKVGAAENGLGGKELDPFTPVTTPVSIANGGTGGVDADAAILNLINAATVRTPVLTDTMPFQDVGTDGGKTTPQNLLNLANSLTAKNTVYFGDKFLIADAEASGVAKSLTYTNLFPIGFSLADQTVSSTGFSNTTNLVVTLVSGQTYFIDIFLLLSQASIGGIKLDMNGGTATVTSMEMMGRSYMSTTAREIARWTALATSVTLSAITGSFAGYARLWGYIRCNAGGTLQIRHARTGASGSATVEDRSVIRAIRYA